MTTVVKVVYVCDLNCYFKCQVLQQLNDEDCDISEAVRWIADQPSYQVAKFSSYRIGGVGFSTRGRDESRKCQNSGVHLLAETMQVSSAKDNNPVTQDMHFYGVITEIWELDYVKFRLPLFKCDWVESTRGVRLDDEGFTIVNLNRKGHLNDTFALGTTVDKIFYIDDQKNPGWSVVLKMAHRGVYDYDDLVGDNVDDIGPFVQNMPSISREEDLDSEDEGKSIEYLRDDDEGIEFDC